MKMNQYQYEPVSLHQKKVFIPTMTFTKNINNNPVLNLLTICLSIFNIARLDSLSCPIVDRKYVFSLRRQENDLSAEHNVAGMVASISAALEKLGKVDDKELETKYFMISLAILR